MTPQTNVQAFFAAGVENLSDDYYVVHNDHCDICMEVEHAAPLDTDFPGGLDLVTSSAVVKTRACRHVFHKFCLDHWLSSSRFGAGTCPKCRHVLVKPQSLADLSLHPPPSSLAAHLERMLAYERTFARATETMRRENELRLALLQDVPQEAPQLVASPSVSPLGRTIAGFRRFFTTPPRPDLPTRLQRLQQERTSLEEERADLERRVIYHRAEAASLERRLRRHRREQRASSPRVEIDVVDQRPYALTRQTADELAAGGLGIQASQEPQSRGTAPDEPRDANEDWNHALVPHHRYVRETFGSDFA